MPFWVTFVPISTPTFVMEVSESNFFWAIYTYI